jgi:NADPH:quinone reductase-like Zn-dependent oxidoreductase
MREPRNRVVQVKRFGGPDELEVVDAPLPTAGRDEVRVRVLASSVEYTDVVIRRHRRPPFVMGYDVVGEIDQLGDRVSGLHIATRHSSQTSNARPALRLCHQGHFPPSSDGQDPSGQRNGAARTAIPDASDGPGGVNVKHWL